jgi:hypothetical protein
MLDNRSKLMKRLAEIMPKEAADRAISSPRSMRIEIHPIRQSAESFTHWLNDDLPANREELISMLWVFGEILNGEMERMLNESMRLQNDLLATQPIKSIIFEKLEAKAEAFYDACASGNLKDMERLAPKGPTYGQVVKPRTKVEEQRIINAVNRVRMEMEDITNGTEPEPAV